MDRLPREERDEVKDAVLRGLGVPYNKVADSLYLIGNQMVNVKLTRPGTSGLHWFNFQRGGVDSCLWICLGKRGEVISYYWVPAKIMETLLTKSSYRDRFWEARGRHIPNFEIDTTADSYLARGFSAPIGQFRDPISPPSLSQSA